jgi:1-acyl-sn-glycerol-3-phosphate acyltransferase
MIPIDRDDPALAKRTLDEAEAKLGKTVSGVIFPAGTRAPAGQMLPFKGGAFVFAIHQQVSIVPVALHNTAQVMPAHGYLTILGGRVVVEVLRPIPTVGLTFEDRHRLKEQVRTALLEALRPEDGGVADRRDLGSFAGHAFGVHAANGAGRTPSGATAS